ncbi:MAG: ribokinase, partial [Leifsonia sp.]
MSSIVILGSANMDLVVRQPRLPHPGETMFGSSFDTVPGGKGLNQAVAAARAGGDVAFLGAIGRDRFGDALRDSLRNAGIDVHGLADVRAPTGTAHISVLDGGENAIVVVPGANAAITELDEYGRTCIEQATHLMAQFERPIELIREAFVVAHKRGVTTVLTPAPVTEVDDELMKLVDLLIPNAQEACELVGVTDETEA